MTRRPIVHVLEPIHESALEHLGRHAEILTGDKPFPSHCDAVIARVRRVGEEEMAVCPNLKVIGKHGAGTDTIDVEAARARGIKVLSTPGANAESVADLALAFALNLLRNVHSVTLAVKACDPVPPSLTRGWELAEMPVGIAGLGVIGRAVARRLINGFGCEVSAFDPGLSEEAWPPEVIRAPDLALLLSSSRLLFVHMPLTPQTRGLIDAAALRAMPSGSYLVNCARGGIVDEAALAEALCDGHLAGAASDVFTEEPPRPDNPLLRIPNFLATPHLGASTNGGLERVGNTIVEKVLAALGAGPGGTGEASRAAHAEIGKDNR